MVIEVPVRADAGLLLLGLGLADEAGRVGDRVPEATDAVP